MPYLARRDFAEAPSLDLRDWNRPASRPYFSVVSSAVSSFVSSSLFKTCRADEDDVDSDCLGGVGFTAFRWRAR